jgi:hypothetical protein
MRVLAAMVAACCDLKSTNQLGVKSLVKALRLATSIFSSRSAMRSCRIQ